MIICIPALERHNYRDLHVLLESIKMYGDLSMQTWVFHKGRSPKFVGVKENTYIKFIPQKAENRHFGDACRQITEAVPKGETIFFVNDDTVFTPTTVPVLLDDISLLDKASIPWGLLGLRTNFSAGLQNIRSQHGTLEGMQWTGEQLITEVDTVFGTAFAVKQDMLALVPDDWTQIQWFGDNLLSYDLRKKGWKNFVSRSYIHHAGSQSGKDYQKYERDGLTWLWKNRPDFAPSVDPYGKCKD